MGLKPDRWIKEMARKHNMIEPFEPEQIRFRNGQRVISYGTSSYGYDIRIADEFKIFTNALSAVVDPKRMAPGSYVDFEGDVCTIPPNSFVLGRTIEYFRIPRNVLTICLGKSTYARCGLIVNVTPFEPCLSSDTEVLTREGWVNIADIQIGDNVLTRRDDGVAEYNPVQKKQAFLFDGDMMHFDGKSISQLVTPDHKVFVWLRNSRNNTYKDSLRRADSIFGKYNYSFDRRVKWHGNDPGDTIEINGDVYPTNAFLRFLGCWLGDGSAYHGNDGGYIIKLAAVTKERKFEYFDRTLQNMGIKNARRHERGFMFYKKSLCEYLMQFGHAKDKFIPRNILMFSAKRLIHLVDGLMASDGNAETQTYTTASVRLANDVQELAFKVGRYAIVRSVESKICGKELEAYKVRFCDTHATPKMPPKNHKRVPYSGMVYDITIENHIFFMRHNGKASWTGNCWQGHATLEISNTTPLPARIYANEGIAQVLFFEADEECECSYADRKGKYQGQRGIVLPKA